LIFPDFTVITASAFSGEEAVRKPDFEQVIPLPVFIFTLKVRSLESVFHMISPQIHSRIVSIAGTPFHKKLYISLIRYVHTRNDIE
jgi:hypothetical protein